MYHEIDNETQERITNLVRSFQQASLATFGERFPLVTKVMPAFVDGEIYLLLSDLSEHTRNIKEHSKRVSIYFAAEETHATRLNNPRYTVMGKLYPVPYNNEKNGEQYQRMLKEFDKMDKGASMYGMFGDFNIYRFEQMDHLYVEGFGKAYK
jgi:putative heme iron utilization protein